MIAIMKMITNVSYIDWMHMYRYRKVQLVKRHIKVRVQYHDG